METLTTEEKELILKAIELMFQAGAIRGDLDFMENMVTLARSINTKLVIDTIAEKVPSMNTDGISQAIIKNQVKPVT